MSRLSRLRRKPVAVAGFALLGAVALVGSGVLAATPALANGDWGHSSHGDHSDQTTTPIKHLVVIFDENISFDHYFGTYPNAANTDGTPFTASKNTPKANTLVTSGTLTNNPNLYAPKRLTPAQAVTCDQNHSYKAEQQAVNGGAMDQFVQKTETDTCTGAFGAPGLVMDYYDGNTVTGLWNYAQNYAMSDNSWDTTFGPSTPGALNLISGQTHGGTAYDPTTGAVLTASTAVQSPNAQGVGTVIGDPDRLRQVAVNLLSNAVRFSDEGGRVRVDARRTVGGIEVVVTDEGQGIPAHFLPHVFERFRQANAREQRAHGGLGLGLSIVRQLVELHGGSVTAASDGPGTGAVFTVILPAKASAGPK